MYWLKAYTLLMHRNAAAEQSYGRKRVQVGPDMCTPDE